MRDQNAELTLTRRIAEAALLLALFTALAFQYIRFEVFETEKNAVLGLLAAIILGANIAEFIQVSRLPRFKNPLVLSVAAFLGMAAISTIFSIDRSYSFWGSPTRGHGLITILTYAILFWQATRSGRRLQEALLPILAVTSIPMCLWAIISEYQAVLPNYRPASTAGNPNYLAGWLAMFMLFFVVQVYWRVFHSGRPFTRLRLLEFGVYGVVFVLAAWAFVVASSRGAFFGVGVATVMFSITLASLYKQRLFIIGIFAVFVVAIAGYFLVSQNFKDRSPGWDSSLARIFIPYDESRVILWETAVGVIRDQGDPLLDVNDKPDQWAFIRPAFGYGMETLEQTQSRFGERFEESDWSDRYVERFHNLFFDWMAETGSMGLLTLIIIYETGFYLAMRKLGLIRQEQVWLWLLFQFVGVPLGILAISTVIYQAEWTSLIPLGSAVGSLGGTAFWIARYAFVKPPASENGVSSTNDQLSFRLNHTSLTVISLICVLSTQWVDNQFGFMQIMSQTLFFILLGFLVSLTAETDEVEIPEEQDRSIRESNYWYASTLIVGLFLLYSMGRAFTSNITTAAYGTKEQPVLLAAVFIIGLAAAIYFSLHERATLRVENEKDKRGGKKRKGQSKQRITQQSIVTLIFVIAVSWLLFFGFRSYLIDTAGDMLNSSLSGIAVNRSPSNVQRTYLLYSLNGICLVIFSTTVLFWAIKAREKFTLTGVSVVFVAVFLAVGVVFYARNFMVSAMWQIAKGLTEDVVADDPFPPLVTADVTYAGAVSQQPEDTKLRLKWAESLMRQSLAIRQSPNVQQSLNVSSRDLTIALWERIDHERQAALDTAPFFIHSKTWEVFDRTYNEYRRVLGIHTATQPTQQPPIPQQPSSNQLPPGLPLPTRIAPQQLPPGLPVQPPNVLPTSIVPGSNNP